MFRKLNNKIFFCVIFYQILLVVRTGFFWSNSKDINERVHSGDYGVDISYPIHHYLDDKSEMVVSSIFRPLPVLIRVISIGQAISE